MHSFYWESIDKYLFNLSTIISPSFKGSALASSWITYLLNLEQSLIKIGVLKLPNLLFNSSYLFLIMFCLLSPLKYPLSLQSKAQSISYWMFFTFLFGWLFFVLCISISFIWFPLPLSELSSFYLFYFSCFFFLLDYAFTRIGGITCSSYNLYIVYFIRSFI